MRTDTAERIVKFITQHRAATPHELQAYLGIGAPALFRQLKKLYQANIITKSGRSPKVFYTLLEPVETNLPTADLVDDKLTRFIDQNWLSVSPQGEIYEGQVGFTKWCQRLNLPVAKTALEYQHTREKYNHYCRNGLIDGMSKMKQTFSQVYLDDLYYLDFYSIERFGKTKLGALLLYAKQSQDRKLMARLFELVKPRIERFVRTKKIEAVGFVPPTINRVLQLQKEFAHVLAINLPSVKITKATGNVTVAQKTLSKLADRIENAAGSIFVEQVPKAKRILLIDDAVGSGASLNETARKIKEKNPRASVIGLAITGSFKGFDVLNEV